MGADETFFRRKYCENIGMLTFHRVPYASVNWGLLDSYADRTVYQTQPWVDFIAHTQKAEPVIAEIRDGRDVVGYFTGLMVQRFGLRILGSPLPGWTTAYMGFNLVPGVERCQALAALVPFAFEELHCVHLEVLDRYAVPEDVEDLEYEIYNFRSHENDLRPREEDILQTMNKSCRANIRRATANQIVIEETDDPIFADEYYAQLLDVFAKHSLVPTYNLERVRELVRCLLPSGRGLYLRALAPDGHCVATSLSFGFGKRSYGWGCASWKKDLHLRPNELVQWYEFQYWKRQGMEFYDQNGSATYKRKYGCYDIAVPWFRQSRSRSIATLRNQMRALFYARQRMAGRWGRLRREGLSTLFSIPGKTTDDEVAANIKDTG